MCIDHYFWSKKHTLRELHTCLEGTATHQRQRLRAIRQNPPHINILNNYVIYCIIIMKSFLIYSLNSKCKFVTIATWTAWQLSLRYNVDAWTRIVGAGCRTRVLSPMMSWAFALTWCSENEAELRRATSVHNGLETLPVFDSEGWEPANEGNIQNTLDEGTVKGL